MMSKNRAVLVPDLFASHLASWFNSLMTVSEMQTL